VDLGGTKIAAVVLGPDGAQVWAHRIATPRDDYAATVAAITALVHEGERVVGRPVSVGVGIPGAPSRATGRIKNANSTWLNDRPLREDLEAALGRPVRLANDANCLVVSEATDGAAAGAAVVFGVILGTGTGGGVVVNGALLDGRNAIAGEWGHNPLPWPEADELPGATCYCGRQGCLETWLSGPALARDYARAGGDPIPSEVIVVRAAAGENRAQETLSRWEHRLARSLATVINVIDPDVIVVGGGLSRLPGIYDRIPQIWGPWVFSDVVTTVFVPARYGDASGVRGAAWLWPSYTERTR
jgi:fructokinase